MPAPKGYGTFGFSNSAYQNSQPQYTVKQPPPSYQDLHAKDLARYGSAINDPFFGNNPALFGQGEDVNNALAQFMGIYGGPQQWLSGINNQYDIAAGNLGQRGETARGQAMSAAGGQAGARGLLNSSGFVNQTGAQAYNPFVNALQGLEGQRAEALTGRDQQMRQLLLQLVTGVKQQSQARDYQNEQNKPGWLDWLSLPIKAGATILGGGMGGH